MTPGSCKILAFILIFISFLTTLYSQDTAKRSSFYEVIQDDSVKLYFNSNLRLTNKACAQFVRYTRIDTAAKFTGPYTDVGLDNKLLSKGFYINGLKHGYFEFYYPDGKMQCKGSYLQNLPVGKWEYFHENGRRERTLNIIAEDTLLMGYSDIDGEIMVQDGFGYFKGEVLRKNTRMIIAARGKIENGKPHGKWTAYYMGQQYCKEEFDHGKFIKGSSSFRGPKRPYTSSMLSNFFLPKYPEVLEYFLVQRCEPAYSRKYKFNIQKFNADLRIRLNRIIEEVIQENRENGLAPENNLTIQFSIDKDGRPDDFTLLSNWGQPLYYAIRLAIKTECQFPPELKKMYFHLKLNLSEKYMYNYSFYFSEKP